MAMAIIVRVCFISKPFSLLATCYALPALGGLRRCHWTRGRHDRGRSGNRSFWGLLRLLRFFVAALLAFGHLSLLKNCLRPAQILDRVDDHAAADCDHQNV